MPNNEELLKLAEDLAHRWGKWALVGERGSTPYLVRYCHNCGRRETKGLPKFTARARAAA